MSFKNKQQEVLEIQLTKYGKEKYIKGEFNPTYYAFSDSDILYDIAYGFHTEHQHNAYGRIVTGTQRQDITPHKVSVESTSKQAAQGQKFNAILGTSAIGEQNYPALKAVFIKGEISGTVTHVTGAYISDRIPQIPTERTVLYEIDTQNVSDDIDIVLDIQELNGIFQKENFEITVDIIDYITATNGDVVTSSRPLEFFNPRLFTRNMQNLFVGGLTQQQIIESLPAVTQDHVEYYIIVETDEQISSDITISQNNGNIYDQFDPSDDIKEC